MNIINSYRYSEGFSPADISGLSLWLDADDASTVLDNTVSGSPVTDGNLISRWDDKSTNANYCTQGNTLKKLTKQSAQVNGRDVIECDGTNKYMISNSNISINQTSNKTIFTCGQPTTANDLTDGSCWSFPQSSQTGSGGHVTFEPAYRCNSVTWLGSETISLTSPHIVTVQQSGSGTIFNIVDIWLDGSAVTRSGGIDGNLVNQNNTYMIGKIGDEANTNFLFEGYICEIIVYDSALSTADRQAVESYLTNKWGV